MPVLFGAEDVPALVWDMHNMSLPAARPRRV